jgi:hypothetical protein
MRVVNVAGMHETRRIQRVVPTDNRLHVASRARSSALRQRDPAPIDRSTQASSSVFIISIRREAGARNGHLRHGANWLDRARRPAASGEAETYLRRAGIDGCQVRHPKAAPYHETDARRSRILLIRVTATRRCP